MRPEGYSDGLEEARDIRIVEVRGSTPLCSTESLADQGLIVIRNYLPGKTA